MGFSEHFTITPFLCSKLTLQKAESKTKQNKTKQNKKKISASALGGVVKSPELVRDLSISYFSLKSVIFC